MITFENISKIYEIGGEKIYALDNASLHISQGEFVGIVGPSGSGKSTLMNIMGCLDLSDSGTYMLDGQEIGKYSSKQLAKIRNNKIGFIFQNFNLLAKLTVYENVELPLIYQGLDVQERKKRVLEVIERVGLTPRMAHTPLELSGGQQQRVAIARALATKPSILLADEPTGNLDSKTGVEIMNLFHELNAEGNTIILITHDDKVAKQAKRRIEIFDGRVTEVG